MRLSFTPDNGYDGCVLEADAFASGAIFPDSGSALSATIVDNENRTNAAIPKDLVVMILSIVSAGRNRSIKAGTLLILVAPEETACDEDPCESVGEFLSRPQAAGWFSQFIFIPAILVYNGQTDAN
jgi:hypothetical protein